ncbi:VOC family protein [Nitratireductor mangrovi]|uniref:VOC family protein n=1 Tax=Nitratireductor mangrovi TaxID=2599600 RepID=A0A5B8KTR0_9HYPH|nr:VOC family protein [Nitratireductor mangrovi]QDY98997.1 VOC family protein [Nitratireductor mangrovi]
MKFIPYLSFDGRCREAFEFYAKVLGGRIEAMLSHGETPAGAEVSPGWQDKILNAHLVTEAGELMGADSPPEFGSAEQKGVSISIQIEDEARAEAIFNAFADGGTVTMPFETTFWAKKFGMVTDRFGTSWMINCAQAQ